MEKLSCSHPLEVMPCCSGPAPIIIEAQFWLLDVVNTSRAAKLYAPGFVEVYQYDHIGLPGGYDVWNNTYQALDLRINVLHGTDNLDSTRWEISTCPDIGIAACEGQWTSYQQGTGAVRQEQ